MIRRRIRHSLATAAAAALLLAGPLVAQKTERAKQIGGKFMCMCGCNQVLTQCNHVGCTTSAAMLKELDDSLAKGGTEQSVTQAFVQEYGTRVYAEPPKSGLSLVAWVMPFVYLALGVVLVIFVISRWRSRPEPQAAAPGAAGGPKVSQELLERARAQAARETED